MKPGDTFLSMDLASGGHLTHGAKPNQSGKWFNPVHYGVTKETNTVDYDQVRQIAKLHKPNLIIAGGSAIPRIWDFKKFRDICDEVGAFLLVDMAHISYLVEAGVHPNPLDYADVVTSTTHKHCEDPEGDDSSNDPDIAKKVTQQFFQVSKVVH